MTLKNEIILIAYINYILFNNTVTVIIIYKIDTFIKKCIIITQPKNRCDARNTPKYKRKTCVGTIIKVIEPNNSAGHRFIPCVQRT